MIAEPALGASGLALLFVLTPATAQTSPSVLREKSLPYVLNSRKPQNEIENADARSGIKAPFTQVIHAQDALWIRLYFSELVLDGASAVRMTSLADGEVQVLDASSAREWNLSSAYFNGDSVQIELLAAPGTTASRLAIDHIGVDAAMEEGGAGPDGGSGLCGICGADDRVPSYDNAFARLMPSACSATVFNTCSCLVSAGHCATAGMVVQFNVPSSLSNCAMVNPPVADQFPIVSYLHTYGGMGNDWSVLKTGTNSLGQKPYDRYGLFRPIATTTPTSGTASGVWGYGVDSTCINNQRQQYSPGSISVVGNSSIQFTCDVRTGNSGSGVIANGKIVGVATNCSCPSIGTRVSVATFATARATLCSCPGSLPTPCTADINGDQAVNMVDLLAVIDEWGACPSLPASCPSNVSQISLGVVDVNDLLTVVNAWGYCQ